MNQYSLEGLDPRFLNDLYLFYQFFVANEKFKDKRKPAKHIKELCHYLMKLKLGLLDKHLGVSMPPRHKLAHDTPILTPEGWTTHGELKVGDYVFGLNGNPTKIIGISDEELCTEEIEFTNGARIECHKGHLWTVDKYRQKSVTITTSEIKDHEVYYEGKKKRYTYQLPLIEPLQFPEKKLPIDPYWLGLWLGDGSASKPCITHAKKDSEWIKYVPYKVSTQPIHKDTGVLSTYFSNQNLLLELRKLNLYNNKHIPEIYKKASVNQRLELLAGLIDSDGSVDTHERVRFVNVNKRLIDDFYELSMGLALYPYQMKPRSPEESNKYKHKWNETHDREILSKQISYVVGFQPRYPIPTKTKRKRINGNKGLRRRYSIKKVESVNNPKMGKCIEIESEDGIYLAGKELVPTHNSKSSAITIAFPLWLIFQDHELDILIISNTYALAEKFGIELREFVKKWGPYFNVYLSDVKHSSTYLKFCDRNGKLYGGSIRLTGAGGSITGFDADWLIIDDPYKGEEEDFTPTALQKKIDWYLTVIDQRIEPETKFLILHTRWHSQDLIGYFKEHLPDDFLFITFPSIKEDNTPLWPEQYSIEELEKRKEKIGERLFSAIYQQMPLDDTSDFFDVDSLQYIDELQPDEEITDKIRVWDIQSSESITSDYTAGSLIVKTNQERIGCTDIIHGQFAGETKQKILDTAKSDGYNVKILIETGVAAAGDLLFQEWEKQLKGYRVYRAKAIKSKPDRATPLKNGILDKRFFLLLNDKKIIEKVNRELRAFPEGQHDDIIDTFAYGYNYFYMAPKPAQIYI